jgi:predicted enzyme related to lactoylglutathione lyase
MMLQHFKRIADKQRKEVPMDATNKIDYIEFPTTNVEATKTFFTKLLGWKFEDYGSDYTSFQDGRIAGGFWRSDKCAGVAEGGVLVVLYHPRLEEIHQRVVELGGTISKEIFSFPGGRRFHFREPGGNELAIWSE